MNHIQIVETGKNDRILEFSHFDHDAPKGLWKRENIIILDSIKINLFAEGSFSVFSDGVLHFPIYGDICLFSPKKMHYGQITEPMHINYYQLDVGLGAFDDIPGGNLLIKRLLESVSMRDAFIRPEAHNRDAAFGLCREIETSICKNELALAYAKSVEFLSLLCNLYFCSDRAQGMAITAMTSQAMRYIEKNYSENITVESIAKETGVSTSYISRVFKNETGMGIHEYLNQYRILKASSLLEMKSVTETGYLCGFSDSSHFISVFKKYMGVTPMNYKKRNENSLSQ